MPNYILRYNKLLTKAYVHLVAKSSPLDLRSGLGYAYIRLTATTLTMILCLGP